MQTSDGHYPATLPSRPESFPGDPEQLERTRQIIKAVFYQDIPGVDFPEIAYLCKVARVMWDAPQSRVYASRVALEIDEEMARREQESS